MGIAKGCGIRFGLLSLVQFKQAQTSLAFKMVVGSARNGSSDCVRTCLLGIGGLDALRMDSLLVGD